MANHVAESVSPHLIASSLIHNLALESSFLVLSQQSQMLPLLMSPDIMQPLPVFLSAGGESPFPIKMVLS